jgi:hypothetical protein
MSPIQDNTGETGRYRRFQDLAKSNIENIRMGIGCILAFLYTIGSIPLEASAFI